MRNWNITGRKLKLNVNATRNKSHAKTLHDRNRGTRIRDTGNDTLVMHVVGKMLMQIENKMSRS